MLLTNHNAWQAHCALANSACLTHFSSVLCSPDGGMQCSGVDQGRGWLLLSVPPFHHRPAPASRTCHHSRRPLSARASGAARGDQSELPVEPSDEPGQQSSPAQLLQRPRRRPQTVGWVNQAASESVQPAAPLSTEASEVSSGSGDTPLDGAITSGAPGSNSTGA